MKTKAIRRLTKPLPVVGQGTGQMGGVFQPDYSQDRQCVRALRTGLDLGLTIVDTAEGYGGGHTEELIAQAIESRRDGTFLITKVGPEHLRHDDLIAACEGSLKRLRTDYVDLYMIHWPNPAVGIEQSMAAMARLKEDGKIHHIGVSNFSLAQLQGAQAALGSSHTVDAIQAEFNLFDRSIESGLLLYCEQNQILTLAYSPLDQGHIRDDGPAANALLAVAEKHNAHPTQIILAWLFSHPVVVPIPKALKTAHICSNAAAGHLELSSRDIATINGACPCAPSDVPVDAIKVVLDGEGNRQAYQTIDDALTNFLGFVPSPQQLAADLALRNEPLKPVRVRRSTESSERHDFELIEGRIRYWAWVIAHGSRRNIPVLIR